MVTLSRRVKEARACRICLDKLPHGVRPVLQVSKTAKILIAGQAPGAKVHATSIPFDDASGDRLRNWMGISAEQFYDPAQIAILPMGFCYPGTGKSGDLPPRPECAPRWRQDFLDLMPQISLMLVIGTYAAKWHLGARRQKTLTETVLGWQDFISDGLLPLPHPSPRNNIWMKKNQWFETDVLPVLKTRISRVLD